MKNQLYKPCEVARLLSEEFGNTCTPSVIRKWDNEILKSICNKGRKKNEGRVYTMKDVHLFNVIAVLRSCGYSLDLARMFLMRMAGGAVTRAHVSACRRLVASKKRGLNQFETTIRRNK